MGLMLIDSTFKFFGCLRQNTGWVSMYADTDHLPIINQELVSARYKTNLAKLLCSSMQRSEVTARSLLLYTF